MPVTGNGEQRLRALVKQIAALASAAKLRSELSKNLAAEARKQVADEFQQQRDPYGVPWPKTIRGGQPLALTGRLRNSIRPVANASGFTLVTNVLYASLQNYGGVVQAKDGGWLTFNIGGRWARKRSVTIPKRQFFPGSELGPIWTAAFERVVTAWLNRTTNARFLLG